MAAFRSPRARPLLYAAAAAVAGTSGLYLTYRPFDVPGSDAPVAPLRFAADGSLAPPRFPRIKSRAEQIADLKRSGGNGSTNGTEGNGSILARIRGAGDADRAPNGEDEGEPYDLLVIGGGATGSGIALDAATRGLRVALVEKDDFSSGTSSKSTKLVHGGVRYLEKAVWQLDYNQYKLVKEALKERKYFLDTAPHLSTWLPIMLPVQKWWQAPYFWMGTKAYDFLAGSEGIESSYFLTRSKALEAFPMLQKNDLVGALVYYGTKLFHQQTMALMNVQMAHTTTRG